MTANKRPDYTTDFDYNFMISSLPFDSTMEKYLLGCNQKETKVRLLLQKVKSENRGYCKYTFGKTSNIKLLERELRQLEA